MLSESSFCLGALLWGQCFVYSSVSYMRGSFGGSESSFLLEETNIVVCAFSARSSLEVINCYSTFTDRMSMLFCVFALSF